MSSNDLHTWNSLSDPLPTLPGWASRGRTWAPSVVERNGMFVMYYTVAWTVGYQCISVATSTTPGGPVVDSSPGPLICQTTDGGSIDPNA
jgi:beta-xylosidase